MRCQRNINLALCIRAVTNTIKALGRVDPSGKRRSRTAGLDDNRTLDVSNTSPRSLLAGKNSSDTIVNITSNTPRCLQVSPLVHRSRTNTAYKIVFYTSKTAQKAYYPLPNALGYEDVLSIIHNESLLRQIFWPESTNSNEGTLAPGLSSLVGGLLPSPQIKYSLSVRENGVICTEELPLGFMATITYTLSRKGKAGEGGIDESESGRFSHSETSPFDSRLYLAEERTAGTPRLMAGFVKFGEGPIVKTRNLMGFLNELVRNGRDVAAALQSLHGAIESGDGRKTKGE